MLVDKQNMHQLKLKVKLKETVDSNRLPVYTGVDSNRLSVYTGLTTYIMHPEPKSPNLSCLRQSD